MKRINKNIFAFFALALAFSSCQSPCEHDISNVKEIEPNSLKIAKVEVELNEGHSHAPEWARQKIGAVMWSSKFGGGYFHGNPYSSDMHFPLKRNQRMFFSVDKDGKATKQLDDNSDIFNILASTPRKKYLNGMMNALIVRLYDAQGNRIDNKLRSPEMQKRVQVFYQVVDVKPSFRKYSLPSNYKPTDICYFWYYDRISSSSNDLGDYITDNAVGFRGVIQSLESHTMFKLRMIVTLLPEGKEKEATLRNSVSPSEEQLKNTVFTLDIPIRVITDFPNFSAKAEELMGKDLYDMNEAELEEYDRKIDELENLYFEELIEVFPGFTVKKMKELQEEMYRLQGESSQFYL